MSTIDSTFFLWSSLSRIPAHSFPVFSPSKEIDDNVSDHQHPEPKANGCWVGRRVGILSVLRYSR